MLLVTKYIDFLPDSCQSVKLDWIGNLCYMQAVVGKLNGEKPSLSEDKIDTCEIKGPETKDIDTLRVNIPLAFQSNPGFLKHNPEYAIRVLDDTIEEAKTNKWKIEEDADGCEVLTGIVYCKKTNTNAILKKSGSKGVFVSRLAQDMVKKPSVSWIEKLEEEDLPTYFKRATSTADGAALSWRRGGRNALGFQVPEGSHQEATWALWGAPPFHGPLCIEEWLQSQGWTIASRPIPPRSSRGPWKFHGKNKDKQDNYRYEATFEDRTRRLSIVPWKPSRKPDAPCKVQEISGPRWFSSTNKYDISPTEAFVAQIAPTALDTPEKAEEEDEAMEAKDGKGEIRKADGKSGDSPDKKKPKIAKLRGGMLGPEGTQSHTVELGGTGDCAWRSIAYQLMRMNLKTDLNEERMRQVPSMGRALRAQSTNYIKNTNTDWQKTWAPDTSWTIATEDGPPAKTLQEYLEAIDRENRWVDETVLMGCSCLKKVHLVIFQYEDEAWKKIYVVSPEHSAKAKDYPIILLANDGGHYMPLATDRKPDKSIIETSRDVTRTIGMQLDPIQNSQTRTLCRGAGKELQTPIKRGKEDLDRLIASAKSSSSKTNGAAWLLRSARSARSSNAEASWLLRTPGSSSKDSEQEADFLLRVPTPGSAKSKTSAKNQTIEKENRKSIIKKWNCPLCDCQITGYTYQCYGPLIGGKIRQHLKKLHPHEFHSETTENAKYFSGQLRHGMGLRGFFRPESYKKIAKKDAAEVCPYCKKGLQKCKFFGAKGNRDKSIKKHAKRIDKAEQEARDLGHDPVTIHAAKPQWSGNKKKKSTTLFCKSCFFTSRYSKVWRQKCKGGWNENRKTPPSTPWWEYFTKKVGSNKLFQITGASEKTQAKIKKDISAMIKKRNGSAALARALENKRKRESY
eukprot:Skav203816  [mRNA]  locus=scaffold1236:457679:460578:- [translate_table: standard]